ncbi:MAG: TonB-dependent receptor plug domain-containing protein [Bacteroidia bacterium]|nr:TonB-dependent receptor plug domain-containing protein [Bacteroidia bacterium]
MKHFYLLYGILATLHAGAFAGESWPRAPLAVSAFVAVSGQVTDENGAPFPGVNIVVKGTSSGTTTDNEGRYTIEVTGANSVLVFSFVGYLPQEVSVDNRTVIDVKMAPDVQQLAEIVVTALGIRKESKKLGYAATTVQTDQIQSNRTTNFMESLEGKVAGLDISPPAAGAGASTKIRLRGQTAFSGANNAPLIVINGLPMDQGAIGADGNNARDRGDAMQNINPDDIESITILKGATAAALYGSRAGNGAILITTKSGQLNQGIGIEYASNYTVSTVLDFTDCSRNTDRAHGTRRS